MAIKNSVRRIVYEYPWVPALLITALGALLRFYALGQVPVGLNQDEASAGYDAWALLNYGIDRCGNSWPVLLEAWGSGQNVLYSYLVMPFIALMGLSELSLRLPAAIFGTLTLVMAWLLGRKCRGEGFGLCLMFFLAVNPWHIMMSRWALESNLLPFFLLTGVYFTAASREREWLLLPAAVSFGLSLYAYGTAFFFLPVFLVCAVIWLRKELRPVSFAVSFGVFVLIALPIATCQLINLIGEEQTVFLGMTLPRLTESRQMATSVFGGGGWQAMKENFSAVVSILTNQTDGLVYNSLGMGGMFYIFGLPLAVLGVIVSLGTRKDAPGENAVRLALLACFAVSFLVQANINRMNMLWIFVIYFAALGLYMILCKLKKAAFLPVAAVLVCTALFWNNYNQTLGEQGSELYYPGLGQAIEYAQEQGAESVYITDYVNQPYIFALFYSETDPNEFIKTVDYINPDGAFRFVRSFGKYRFGSAEQAEGEYLILHRSETEGRVVLAEFGKYAVCLG